MEKEMSIKIKVRSYEIDVLGHVNNAVYFNYLEHARVEYLRIAGIPFESFLEDGIYPVHVNININYKRPAFLNDELEIKGKIIKTTRSSVTMEINIYKIETSEIICESVSTYVFVDSRNNKSTKIPKRFIEVFSM